MIKIIDLYILRKFLGSFFYCVLLFAAVATVFDLSENLDEFVEKKVSLWNVFTGYYATFIPELMIMLIPMFVFISVIFFTSRLAGRSEIVAILSSGVSFYRLLWGPYLVGALLLVGLQYYANNYLVPHLVQKKFEFERVHMHKNQVKRETNIYLQTDLYSFITLSSYNPKDSTGRSFVYERIVDGELERKVKADRMHWNKEKDTWELSNYVSRTLKEDGMVEDLKFDKKLFEDFNLKPSDFGKRLKQTSMGTMTTPELSTFIQREREIGSSQVPLFEVEKYRRSSIPFASIILTFLGMAVAARKTRGGMGWHILVGVALSFLFIVFLQFSTTFAINGNLSPLLAVWIPNIVFGLVCIYLIGKAQK